MTVPYLHRTVTIFRKGILNGRSSAQMCFAVCWPLQGYLSILGVQTEIVEGDFGSSNHFWLKCADGETIIDPTADQFSTPERPMPAVFIGQKPYWYKEL